VIPLAAFEEITGASGVAPRIEAMLPAGVRHRQLRVRTLLAGMLLSQADGRPAHLTRVRDALIALPGTCCDQPAPASQPARHTRPATPRRNTRCHNRRMSDPGATIGPGQT